MSRRYGPQSRNVLGYRPTKFAPPTRESDAILLNDFIDGVESGQIHAPIVIAPLLRGAIERLVRGHYLPAEVKP